MTLRHYKIILVTGMSLKLFIVTKCFYNANLGKRKTPTLVEVREYQILGSMSGILTLLRSILVYRTAKYFPKP